MRLVQFPYMDSTFLHGLGLPILSNHDLTPTKKTNPFSIPEKSHISRYPGNLNSLPINSYTIKQIAL